MRLKGSIQSKLQSKKLFRNFDLSTLLLQSLFDHDFSGSTDSHDGVDHPFEPSPNWALTGYAGWCPMGLFARYANHHPSSANAHTAGHPEN